MATAISAKWTNTSPQIQMTVNITSSTDTAATLSWTLQYVASSAASSSSRKYYASIAGTQVTSGWYAINGKVGTYTIASGTTTITKTTAAQTISFSGTMEMNLTWSGVYGGTKTASGSISVPAKTSYVVSYNANGGSGAPSNQTKWYGTALTLSSTKPTRTGYTFQGWATSASGGVAYASGASYTANAKVTLYAVWKAHIYTISYSANGGSGAPDNQTKTYGVTLKLSTTIPERDNYTFKGWSTSASATTATYASGANYTANSGATLYAVWELAYTKPRITNLSISRCDSSGTPDDNGTYGAVVFSLNCDQALKSIEVRWESETAGSGSVSPTIPEVGGISAENVFVIFGNGSLSTEYTYAISVIVTDAAGYSYSFGTLAGTKFVIDFKAGGTGAAFGKPAELDDVLDIAFQTRHTGGLLPVILEPETDLNETMIPSTYVGADLSRNNYTCGGEPLPITTGTFTLEIVSMGEEGQIKQRLTYCHKTAARTWERIYYASSWGEWVCVSDFDGQLLWSGAMYMNGSQTITLAESISKQRSGIALVFSRYSDSTARDYHFNTFFVPKYQIKTHTGCGHTFMMTTDASFGLFAAKYLYINDETIVGNDINVATGTGTCGITYANNGFVLRYVIGM